MADKNFKVKNKLVIAGLTNSSGVLLAEGHTVDSHTNLATQYGGTGTTTSPTSGQILYSSSGSTYAPTNLSSLITAATPTALGTVYGRTSVYPNNTTAIGEGALRNLTSQNGNNTAIGSAAGNATYTGINNTFLGTSAGVQSSGSSNILIGYLAGYAGAEGALYEGDNNIIIGVQSNPSATNTSNEITLGNTSITRFRIPGLGIDWNKNIEIMNIMGAY